MTPLIKQVLVFLGVIVFLIAAGFLMHSAVGTLEKAAYGIEYEESVKAAAAEYELPESLLFAVIHTESRFQPEAESSVGARGLMQITQDTFDWINYRRGEEEAVFDDLYDPARNIDYGAFLLRYLLDEFGSVDVALAGYHAGVNQVRRWLENPEYSADGATLIKIPFDDTRAYVKTVNEAILHYQNAYDMD